MRTRIVFWRKNGRMPDVTLSPKPEDGKLKFATVPLLERVMQKHGRSAVETWHLQTSLWQPMRLKDGEADITDGGDAVLVRLMGVEHCVNFGAELETLYESMDLPTLLSLPIVDLRTPGGRDEGRLVLWDQDKVLPKLYLVTLVEPDQIRLRDYPKLVANAELGTVVHAWEVLSTEWKLKNLEEPIAYTDASKTLFVKKIDVFLTPALGKTLITFERAPNNNPYKQTATGTSDDASADSVGRALKHGRSLSASLEDAKSALLKRAKAAPDREDGSADTSVSAEAAGMKREIGERDSGDTQSSLQDSVAVERAAEPPVVHVNEESREGVAGTEGTKEAGAGELSESAEGPDNGMNAVEGVAPAREAGEVCDDGSSNAEGTVVDNAGSAAGEAVQDDADGDRDDTADILRAFMVQGPGGWHFDWSLGNDSSRPIVLDLD
ncbi:hypothetical protein OH77DRAFT_1590867 [Trametes cingulata]|nr:hypothetical protein OH77DRAFT_1590867 [Trametes cingulata]